MLPNLKHIYLAWNTLHTLDFLFCGEKNLDYAYESVIPTLRTWDLSGFLINKTNMTNDSSAQLSLVIGLYIQFSWILKSDLSDVVD